MKINRARRHSHRQTYLQKENKTSIRLKINLLRLENALNKHTQSEDKASKYLKNGASRKDENSEEKRERRKK